eukprot:39364_1
MTPDYIICVAFSVLLSLITSTMLLSTIYRLQFCCCKKLEISNNSFLICAMIEYILWFSYAIAGTFFYFTHNSVARLLGNVSATFGAIAFYILMTFRLWFSFRGTPIAITTKSIYIQSIIILLLFLLLILCIIFLNIKYIAGMAVSVVLLGIIYIGGMFWLSYKFNHNLLRLIANYTRNDPNTSFEFSGNELLFIQSAAKHSLLASCLLLLSLSMLLFWCILIPLSLIIHNSSFFITTVRLSTNFLAHIFVVITYLGFGMNVKIYTKICRICDAKFRRICEVCTKQRLLEEQKQMNMKHINMVRNKTSKNESEHTNKQSLDYVIYNNGGHKNKVMLFLSHSDPIIHTEKFKVSPFNIMSQSD